MKIKLIPFMVQLNIILSALLVLALYVSYCYNLEVSAMNWTNLLGFFQGYWYFFIAAFFTILSLLKLNKSSPKLVSVYYILFLVFHVYIARDNFAKAYLFYTLGLATLLFYFQDLLGDEMKKSYYNIGFIKDSVYKSLGKKIKVKLDDRQGDVLYWDSFGIVAEFEKLEPEIGKRPSVLVEFLGDSYQVELRTIIADKKLNRIGFMFLPSKKNSDTLRLQRRLYRLGWNPELLV